MDSKFWKGKKVLITGYEGFLGSHLTRQLINFNTELFGLDIKVNRKETILTRNDLKNIKIIKSDVCNFNNLKKVINRSKIEYVFHLAAQALVGHSNIFPLKTFESNIKGTWNILEACRNSKSIKAVIIASSDKAYGINKCLPYKEDSPLSGCHPYDVSKSCSDLLAYTYYRTYQLPVAVTRCGNIFGPGDFNFSRIVPDAIRSILKNRILFIRSDGKFTRDYIYVEDIVKGYILLAQKAHKLRLFGEAFNFSNECPISVLSLVGIISKISGQQRPRVRIQNIARYEIPDQYLSSQKARKILGWNPEYSLQKGLARTINWYKEYFLRNL